MREFKIKGKCYRYDRAQQKMVEIQKVGELTLPQGIKPPDEPASLYFDVKEKDEANEPRDAR